MWIRGYVKGEHFSAKKKKKTISKLLLHVVITQFEYLRYEVQKHFLVKTLVYSSPPLSQENP